MPTDHQQLVYNVTGQEFVLYPPEGVPSAASVAVYPWDTGDDGTAETATTGSVTLGGVSTTTDAACGSDQADPKSIPLTTTTNVAVGRDYLLTDADGFREWVTVAEIESGVGVTADAPLLNSYASGATFVETRTRISVVDSWIQDSNKISNTTDPNPGWRIRWEYTVASVVYVRYTYADVVRQPGEHNVSPSDMAMYLGTWDQQLPTDHRVDQGRRLIDEGYRLFKVTLHGIESPSHQIRNQNMVDEAVKRAANYVLQRHAFYSGRTDSTALEQSWTDYNGFIDQQFRVTDRVARATDDSGAGDRVAALPILRR